MSIRAGSLLEFGLKHRGGLLLGAALLALAVAFADWKIEPNISLGILYLLPISLAATVLKRRYIIPAAVAGSLLREAFAAFGWQPGYPFRLLIAFGVFAATGLLISELMRSRELALGRLRDAERHAAAQRELEQRLRAVVESTPLAVLILDARGAVVTANEAAARLLGYPNAHMLERAELRNHVPLAGAIIAARAAGVRGLALECPARRADSSSFLAYIWTSVFTTSAGVQSAVVLWDGSEILRAREGVGWKSLLTGGQLAVRAMAHEVVNAAAAARAACDRLAEAAAVAASADFQAIRAALDQLNGLAAAGLGRPVVPERSALDVRELADEVQILLAPILSEAGIGFAVSFAEAELPLVYADRHALLQVFANLAQSSARALRRVPQPRVSLTVDCVGELVCLTFSDNGPGVAAPQRLFEPLAEGAESHGLGLYISRALIRSFGGELSYERIPSGGCFRIQLPAAGRKDRGNAA